MDIDVVEGDITEQAVDAVVNAANSALLGGGGVDGAIHRAAGPSLLLECRSVRESSHPDGLAVGQAVVTGAGLLPARWVVHTVGPNRHAGQTDPALLASCFRSSLLAAASVGARSVAFPAVSSGVYGWDAAEVARIAFDTVRAVDAEGEAGSVELVRFVLFGGRTYATFLAALAGSTTRGTDHV